MYRQTLLKSFTSSVNRALLIVVLSSSGLCLFAEDFPVPEQKFMNMNEIPEHPLPDDVLTALRTASSITLFSLDPINGEKPSAPNTFHGWPVLGSIEITSAADCKAIVTTVETAVKTAKGLGAKCFDPHHGLRIVSDGRTYDFVLCFTCEHMHIHTTGQKDRYSLIKGKGEVLDKLLSKAKIPLGERFEYKE